MDCDKCRGLLRGLRRGLPEQPFDNHNRDHGFALRHELELRDQRRRGHVFVDKGRCAHIHGCVHEDVVASVADATMGASGKLAFAALKACARLAASRTPIRTNICSPAAPIVLGTSSVLEAQTGLNGLSAKIALRPSRASRLGWTTTHTTETIWGPRTLDINSALPSPVLRESSDTQESPLQDRGNTHFSLYVCVHDPDQLVIPSWPQCMHAYGNVRSFNREGR